MEHELNKVNEESLKTDLKTHKGKPKFMTKFDTTDNRRNRNGEDD